jgi:hypothetical protein
MSELDALRNDIKAFISKHGLTYTEYCAGTNLNCGVLSAFLRETYQSKMLPRTLVRIMNVYEMKKAQYEQ